MLFRSRGRERESVLESLTLARAAMSVDPVAITLLPCPRYYLKPNKYQGLNVTARTPKPDAHLHQSVSRVSNRPFPCPRRQIHLPGSYTPIHTPIRPPTSASGAVLCNRFMTPPPQEPTQFIDSSCQLSFRESAHRINFNYVLMLNILETLNFMVGDAQSHVSIYHLGRISRIHFCLYGESYNLIRSSSQTLHCSH